MSANCYAIRWIPRVVGTLLFLMLIVFAVAEGFPVGQI